MNLEKLNQWLTLTANVGVLVGIIFLAIEIQQNTNAIQYEVTLTEQNIMNGPFTNTDRLPEIKAKINEVQGSSGLTTEFAKTFDLSIEDSLRWTRYLTQVWQINEANWRLVGNDESICEFGKILLSSLDNEIYWNYQRPRYSPEFVDCVENAADPRPSQQSN